MLPDLKPRDEDMVPLKAKDHPRKTWESRYKDVISITYEKYCPG